jgi:PleD family two-component response regulator
MLQLDQSADKSAHSKEAPDYLLPVSPSRCFSHSSPGADNRADLESLMSLKNTNEQILVVDDDQAIRWMLTEALQSWGFVPVEAASVEEGLKQFKAELPALILLDIDLPDGTVDGYERAFCSRNAHRVGNS